MCGIAGYASFRKDFPHPYSPLETLRAMGSKMQTRGPDYLGTFLNESQGVGLVHARLSIQDLSSAGNQPMISKSERYIIVFNGEIYNHHKLRADLSNLGINWQGHSDTETLLIAIEFWGIEKTLSRVSGMFAFAILDRKENTLILARDRFGEKPLYFAEQKSGCGHVFIFASDLYSLRSFPRFSPEIDRASLRALVGFNFISAPSTIYKDVYQVLPGQLVKVNVANGDILFEKYWDVDSEMRESSHNLFSGDFDHATNLLDQMLHTCISEQMISDVPLGVLLSGGVDSSLVAAIAQSESSSSIKTFSVGFEREEFNELFRARKIAKYLNANHTELVVGEKDVIDAVIKMPYIYSEPFADSSQIPTYLVAAFASKQVKVVLTGDGGDEIFCGYNRYIFSQKYWSAISTLPLPLREGISKHFGAFYQICRSILFSSNLYKYIELDVFDNKVNKFLKGMASKDVIDLYRCFMTHNEDPDKLVIGGGGEASCATSFLKSSNFPNPSQAMMYLDTINYLPNDILTKVDRAAMAVSLETRLPFLHHELVKFAWTLPFDFKYKRGVTKYILRKVLEKYIPSNLVPDAKMGFTAPLDSWLRGPLREWAGDLLDGQRLRREGYFNCDAVSHIWNQQLHHGKNHSQKLWGILSFQSWLEVNK